ncbi:hypothetical protein QZH41_012021 [Actinostola sp. cb2023]|nr:hypothetical protein QZH41_012021 [Actinostola sp. cb2023]
MDMFPEKSKDDLLQALSLYGTLTRTALSLATAPPTYDVDDDSDDDTHALLTPVFIPTLTSLLRGIEIKMSQVKEKVKVEEDDILNDAMCYYKDPDFDPKKKLRIQYKGQPAVDTGVTRQFYTELLKEICDTYFHGGTYKTPVYSADVVACGMMKYFGNIIVHSIVQGGPGFPVFSPSVYCYLATGNIDAAMAAAHYGDCCEPIQHFITKVAQAVDVDTLDKDECIDILQQCGLKVSLTNDNKMRVIQSLIVHDVIGRPKIVLDQLVEGLKTLGFQAKMKEYPELFQELFALTISLPHSPL